MEIIRPSIAGTLESSDAMVRIEPAEENSITIELNSVVEKQFGEEIRSTILNTLHESGIEKAFVSVVDKGALDCTLKARVQTAIYRAADIEFNWGTMNYE